jgi:hypothetical protein
MTQAIDMHNSYDSNYMENSEWVVDPFGAYRNHNLRFGNTVYESSDCDYCDFCVNNVKNCFGCISLKSKTNCILNKQFTKEEYEELIPKIIEHMKQTGLAIESKSESNVEWGEFFPTSLSPFAYNESVAHEYYPLEKSEVIKRGLKWKEEDSSKYKAQNFVIPNDILDITDDICNELLTCEITGKNFKIIPQELLFYRKMGLPIPKICPDQRHKERLELRNSRKLFDGNCAHCKKVIQTTYSINSSESVYCEKCYLETIY